MTQKHKHNTLVPSKRNKEHFWLTFRGGRKSLCSDLTISSFVALTARLKDIFLIVHLWSTSPISDVSIPSFRTIWCCSKKFQKSKLYSKLILTLWEVLENMFYPWSEIVNDWRWRPLVGLIELWLLSKTSMLLLREIVSLYFHFMFCID